MLAERIITGEWIDWTGGPCPLTLGQLFEVEHRDGIMSSRPRAADAHWMHPNVWAHFVDKGDIVRYRVVG